MAERSSIEWTDHTHNPWWGCSKVSPACKNCYAETWARRTGDDVWGADAPRRFFGDQHWRAPLRWNREALMSGRRMRVFCASMADVFEAREDLDEHRARLWRLIDETTALDWLLLTKRPENAARMVPWGASWPKNVWLGTTVENQEWAERRVPVVLASPAIVHFVSCEPLLGPVDLSRWLGTGEIRRGSSSTIDWVIAGGESGGKARWMDPGWARSLRDQCIARGVPFHFKQWGSYGPMSAPIRRGQPRVLTDNGEAMIRVGKKTAGRLLDGRTWDGLPQTNAVGLMG